MTSLLKIPSRYDVRVGLGGVPMVVCTAHTKVLVLREMNTPGDGPFIGVDEIVRLVEEHERSSH